MTKLQEMQEIILGYFYEILQTEEPLTGEESFLRTGGTSLGMMRLQTALRGEFGVKLTLRELYQLESAANIAVEIYRRLTPIDVVPAREPQEENTSQPMTDMEKSVYRGRREGLLLGGRASGTYFELRIREYDRKQFLRAAEELVRLHDCLRTRFSEEEGSRIEPFTGLSVPEYDLVGLDAAAQQRRLELYRRRQRCRQYDPAEDLLIGFSVSLMGDGQAVVHASFDGLATDGAGMRMIIQDLIRLYSGNSAVAPDISLQQCRAMVLREEMAEGVEEERHYWESALKEYDMMPELPLLARAQSVAAADTAVLERKLSGNVYRSFLERAKEEGVSPFSLELAIFGKIVSRYSANQSFLINIPGARPSFVDMKQRPAGLLSTYYYVGFSDEEGRTLPELAGDLQLQILDAAEHSGFSGPALSSLISRNNHEQLPPQVTFTDLAEEAMQWEDGRIDLVQIGSHTSQTMLEVQLLNWGDQLHVVMSYETHLLDRFLVEGMLDCLVENLEAVADGSVSLSEMREIALCRRDLDLKRHTAGWESTDQFAYRPVAEVLAEKLNAEDERVAVISEKGMVDYRVLRCKIGHFLSCAEKLCGRMPEKVGLFLGKDPAQIICALGCVLRGIVYAPLETELPLDTVLLLLEREQLDLLVTTEKVQEVLKDRFAGRILTVEFMHDAFVSEKGPYALAAAEGLAPEAPAVFINTSGTTGVPKTAVLTQRSLSYALGSTRTVFGLERHPISIAITGFSHDIAIYDTIGTFLLSGTVVMPSEEKRREPRHWAELMKQYGVTVWNSVPAFMEMLFLLKKEERVLAMRHLNTVLLGGDRVTLELTERIRASCGAVVISTGGPTETTIWNISHIVTDEDSARGYIPYGKPFPGTGYHILDGRMRLCPVGVIGTMYISGPSLSGGYYGDPEQTKVKFQMHEGQLVYDTADLGCCQEDGEIRILGRRDRQVKINGKRIELDGVETVLNSCDGVRKSAVVMDEKRCICAVYLSENGREVDGLQEMLRKSLQEYMIPRKMRLVRELPVTRNGKIDREAIRAMFPAYATEEPVSEIPAACDVSDAGGEALQTFLLESLREILEEDEITMEDDFFDIGGDSIAAMRLSAMIEDQYDVELQVIDLMSCPELSEWPAMILEKMEESA